MTSYGNNNGDISDTKHKDEILDYIFTNNDVLRNDAQGQLPQNGLPSFLKENNFSSEHSYHDDNSNYKPYKSEQLSNNEDFSQFINPTNIASPYFLVPEDTNKNSQTKSDSHTDSKDTLMKDNSVSSTDNQHLSDEERKKKINREAQRAFRRRKEEKLKEMEQKWMNSEKDKQELLQQIEELKKATYEMSMENKELQKKNHVSGSEYNNNTSTASSISHNSPIYNFPNKTEYVQYIYSGSAHDADVTQLKDIRYQTDQGEAMTVSKTWEYLFKQLQEKEQQGYTFDTWQIMSLMKGHEVCHGSGAAYMKSFVDSVINTNVQEL